MIKHVIVIDVVGLEEKHLNSKLLPTITSLAESGESSRMKPVFPAVTCPVQTSLLSGEFPIRSLVRRGQRQGSPAGGARRGAERLRNAI